MATRGKKNRSLYYRMKDLFPLPKGVQLAASATAEQEAKWWAEAKRLTLLDYGLSDWTNYLIVKYRDIQSQAEQWDAMRRGKYQG